MQVYTTMHCIDITWLFGALATPGRPVSKPSRIENHGRPQPSKHATSKQLVLGPVVSGMATLAF